ncbi:MAG: hypothetical protein ACREOF_13895 [Gemmatimonadales bacterium]
MVGLLWTAGLVQAALRLEDCWNELMESQYCSLSRGYPINVGPEFQASEVDGVLCAHTHFVPADADFETAIDLAIADVLGPTADSVRLLLKSAFPSWETLPRAEVAVLWLRRNLPEYVDALLDRAGRHVAEASG